MDAGFITMRCLHFVCEAAPTHESSAKILERNAIDLVVQITGKWKENYSIIINILSGRTFFGINCISVSDRNVCGERWNAFWKMVQNTELHSHWYFVGAQVRAATDSRIDQNGHYPHRQRRGTQSDGRRPDISWSVYALVSLATPCELNYDWIELLADLVWFDFRSNSRTLAPAVWFSFV